jgi:uncharacterized protein (TIGR02147 family)
MISLADRAAHSPTLVPFNHSNKSVPHLSFHINSSLRETIINLIVSDFTAIQAKNRRYSLRAHSRKLGLSPGALSELISGKRSLTFKTLFNIQQVLPQQSTLRHHIGLVLKDVQQSSKNRPVNAEKFVSLKEASFRSIAEWQHYAILTLAATSGFKSDPKWIAKRLAISELLAKSSISRLLELGLMTQEVFGNNVTLRPTYKNLTTTSEVASRALRIAHTQDLDHAKNSLEKVPVELRDITSMTFSLDPALLPEAKLFLKEWRRRFSEQFEGKGTATEVYTLSLCLVPITVPTSQQDARSNATNKKPPPKVMIHNCLI